MAFTPPTIIDSHCHIDFKEFDHDRAQVIKSASDAGVRDIIVPAVSKASWPQSIAICSKYSQLHLALGLHPIFIAQHQPQHLTELDSLLSVQSAVAVGEIGLDYHLKELGRDKQDAFFTKQLIIAKRHDLPVIIHCRKAHDDCLTILTDIKVKGGIIHAFNGSIQQAKKYIELGFLLGFGGMLTFERSTKLHALCKEIPMKSIVLETDSPDMTVSQHKGSRNSPEYLPFVLNCVADLKSLNPTEVSVTSSANLKRLLSI